MKIQFIGAAQEVTGSKHLITTGKGKKILLDCGMFQGKGMETDGMNRDLGFDPAGIDMLILSHAHIDHSGLIPYIYNRGFRGTIFCTPATRDLCAIMLLDSAHIQEHDTHTHNKKRARHGLPPLEPIYKTPDASACMKLFVSIPYNKELKISKGIHLMFTDAGHILGSAAVNLTIKEDQKTVRICFTGDIGRRHNKILRDPQPFPQCDVLITESTYGDRLHEDEEAAGNALLDIVRETCVIKKGKLIIPAFSIGRTQEIVYALDRLESQGKLPPIEVYVDSPLSVNATNIMQLHPECFNEDILDYMKRDPNPFGFNRLHYIQAAEESKALNKTSNPCIIISASGMMEAGRVKHHIANSISSSRNTLLAVGYCGPNTLGARLINGADEVSIFGQRYPVKFDIRSLDFYSAHGDYEEMGDYLSCQDSSGIRQVFLVHGEPEAQEHYKKHLQGKGFRNITIPGRFETYEI